MRTPAAWLQATFGVQAAVQRRRTSLAFKTPMAALAVTLVQTGGRRYAFNLLVCYRNGRDTATVRDAILSSEALVQAYRLVCRKPLTDAVLETGVGSVSLTGQLAIPWTAGARRKAGTRLKDLLGTLETAATRASWPLPEQCWRCGSARDLSFLFHAEELAWLCAECRARPWSSAVPVSRMSPATSTGEPSRLALSAARLARKLLQREKPILIAVPVLAALLIYHFWDAFLMMPYVRKLSKAGFMLSPFLAYGWVTWWRSIGRSRGSSGPDVSRNDLPDLFRNLPEGLVGMRFTLKLRPVSLRQEDTGVVALVSIPLLHLVSDTEFTSMLESAAAALFVNSAAQVETEAAFWDALEVGHSVRGWLVTRVRNLLASPQRSHDARFETWRQSYAALWTEAFRMAASRSDTPEPTFVSDILGKLSGHAICLQPLQHAVDRYVAWFQDHRLAADFLLYHQASQRLTARLQGIATDLQTADGQARVPLLAEAARARVQLGEVAAAAADYEEALRIDPYHADAARELEMLISGRIPVLQ